VLTNIPGPSADILDVCAVIAHTIHVWAAYRQAKTIYEFEPALSECLRR
jgi:hypothetical protein